MVNWLKEVKIREHRGRCRHTQKAEKAEERFSKTKAKVKTMKPS